MRRCCSARHRQLSACRCLEPKSQIAALGAGDASLASIRKRGCSRRAAATQLSHIGAHQPGEHFLRYARQGRDPNVRFHWQYGEPLYVRATGASGRELRRLRPWQQQQRSAARRRGYGARSSQSARRQRQQLGPRHACGRRAASVTGLHMTATSSPRATPRQSTTTARTALSSSVAMASTTLARCPGKGCRPHRRTQSSSWRWRIVQAWKMTSPNRIKPNAMKGGTQPRGMAIARAPTTKMSIASKQPTRMGRIADHPVLGLRPESRCIPSRLAFISNASGDARIPSPPE